MPLYLERPWSAVSIEEIAEHLSLSYWQIYYSFDCREDIYRAAVSLLVQGVRRKVQSAPPAASSVNRTVHRYVRHVAAVVGSDTYRNLLFLCIRDGQSDPWVKTQFEQQIAEPLRAGLEEAIARSGERLGLELVLLHGLRDWFLSALESSLCFPKLMHRETDSREEYDHVIAGVEKRILSGTCSFDGLNKTVSTQTHITA